MWKRFSLAISAGTALLLSVAALAAKIDINTADAAALADGIVGVGPKIAADIVAYRDQNGPFGSIEDLTEVRGIGDKILERNRENLTVDTSSD